MMVIAVVVLMEPGCPQNNNGNDGHCYYCADGARATVAMMVIAIVMLMGPGCSQNNNSDDGHCCCCSDEIT